MSDEQKKRSQRFLVILFMVALGLLALVVRPFAGAFFAAAVLAGVMHRPQIRLASALGKRPNLSAGILTLVLVLVVVVPVGVMGLLAVKEGTRLVRWSIETAREDGLDGLVQPVPEPIRPQVRRGLSFFADEWVANQQADADGNGTASSTSKTALGSHLGSVGRVAGWAQALLTGFADFMIQLGILALSTFFLLAQGPKLVDYLVGLVPLEEQKTRALLTSLREVSVAVFSSTIITAAIQTFVAAIGFLIVGMPSLALIIAATFLCSFIPAFGATGVVLIAAAFVFLGGETGYGIFLALWGLLAVGMIDNIVKPLLTRGATELPGSLVFFGMICGLAVFGPMGMVAGPLIIVLFQVVAGMLHESLAAGKNAPI